MTPRTRLLISMAAGTTLLLPAAPALADAPRFTPGAPGVGDSYFPKEGNGGYDVGHYDLTLNYVPKTNKLVATARIDARAKQNLSRFDLDLKQLSVHSVKVNGQKARYTRKGQELIVTPTRGLVKGSKFQVVVAYSGTPKPINSQVLGKYGWIKTPDGAYVVCEPDGASTWFPGNDHPQDKANFTFRVTVPQGTQVLSNGELTGQSSSAGSSTFVWSERQPMATYLAMLAIGKYQTRTGHTKSGVPVLTAVAPNHTADAKPLFDKTVAAINWEEKVFGKYPFSSTGGIRVGVDVEFSLETQTRPIYGFQPDTDVIVHELAHQWFGDSVGVRRWKDIWLNEGFATYAEWLWHEQHGGPSAKSVYNNLYKVPKGTDIYKELWTRRKAGDPGAGTLFTLTPYYRGGMTLQALRTRIGDKAFFKLLKLWTAQRKYGYATTADFIRLAEKTSHKQLDKLFHEWLYTKHKPTRW